MLVTTLALFLTTVSAWGTVKLSIAPGLVNVATFNGQALGLYESISALCTGGPTTLDPASGLTWHNCTNNTLTIGNGVAVRVDKAAWRNDNPALRNTMIKAVSEAYDALRSHTNSAGNMAAKLHLDTGLQGENMLHVSLLDQRAVATPEQCQVMIPDATKAIDQIMTTFGEQLGHGSTTRVVQCIDAQNNEVQAPSIQIPASAAIEGTASSACIERWTMAFVAITTLLSSAWLWL